MALRAGTALKIRAVASGGTTMPFSIFQQLFKHPLTDSGLKKFLDDWKAKGQQ